jgi:hypothetical protein
MQRGRALPSQHHTLGWNARRDFFAIAAEAKTQMKPQMTPDKDRKKKGKNKAIDGSKSIQTNSVSPSLRYCFSDQCLSAFICGYRRVLPEAGNEPSGWLLF